MTLVRSRLRQLSGSSLVLICAALLIAGCSGSRQASSGNDQTGNLPMVYNPKTGKYEPVANPESLVDTVSWSEPKDATPPITEYNARPKGKKDAYSVAMLMPFNAQRHTYFSEEINPKTSRFLHYYCGVLMAVEELKNQGITLNLNVVDTKEDGSETERKLSGIGKPDVIVGPYERESLKVAAAYAEDKKVPVFSPWTPSVPLDKPSDYFVQITPGLASHARATMKYIESHFDNPQVYLVGQQGGSTESRIGYYRQAYNQFFSPESTVNELLLPKGVYDYPDLDMTTILEEGQSYVFVLPYYLQQDQELINAILRKIHAERGEIEVAVFGLPQWMSMPSINADYLESLNAHITAVQYSDMQNPDYEQFVNRYFEEYHAIPEPSAWQGYEFMNYLGNRLNDFGVGLMDNIIDDKPDDAFIIRPVYKSGARPESKNSVLYYQNDEINVLRFEGYAYRKVF